MKHMPFRLGLDPSNAVLANGEIHFVQKVTDEFITILAAQADAVPQSFTHSELNKLLNEGHYSIKYGYFSDWQAARRARAGRSLLSKLSTKTQLQAFYGEAWCEVMIEEEEAGRFNRSSDRWSEFVPNLHEKVRAKLENGVLKAMAGEPIDPKLLSHVPSRTTAMENLREWEATKDPIIFVKKSTFNGENAKRVHPEVEVIIQVELKNYFHPNQIYPGQVLSAVNAEVRRQNVARGISGEACLPEISLRTVERRINEHDRFKVLASRKGVAYAKNKLGAHGGGLKLHAPLLRVEMDEWEIDLMSILKSGKHDITHPSLRELELGRYWVCVAMDTASRSILGLKLSQNPCAMDAKSVLWMAMRDKTELASRLGCKTPWDQHGHVLHVCVDNGAAFVNVDFKATVSDLGIDYSVMPAGVPELRGTIERFFRSVATQLMPNLTGRTFSSPKEKGDYRADQFAVHTAESIVELLVRFTVDVYHNLEHGGLENATPNNMWDKLVTKFGWSPPQSRHELRHILGLKFERKTGPHGVLMNGVNYHSERLAEHFQKHGQQTVEVSIDPENMGHISVWLACGEDSGWSTLRAQQEGLEGISFVSWERLIFELRQNNREAASLTQGVVDRAIQRIKAIDDEQSAMRQLGPINLTVDKINRAQRETFWGLHLGAESDLSVGENSALQSQEVGFLSDEITFNPGPLPEEKLVLPPPPEEIVAEWFFSDELEDGGAELEIDKIADREKDDE